MGVYLLKWDGEAQLPEDLSRKFAGSFLQIGDNHEVVYCEQIEAGRGFLYRSIGADGRLSPAKIMALGDVEIQKPQPEPGVYQIGNSVGLLWKLSARQWSEGFSAATMALVLNGEEWLQNFGGSVALKVFAPQEDLSFQQGVALMEADEKLKAIRLRRHYWLKRYQSGALTLLRDLCPIGSLVCGDLFWMEKSQILRQELTKELGLHA